MEKSKCIILAGGLGSRLYKYTNSIYPKILLSLGNETMLDKILHFWFEKQKVEELMLVFSEESHYNMVQKYINVFHHNLKNKIVLTLYPKTDGTFNTLRYVLNAYPTWLTKSNLFLSWSDILPKDLLNYIEFQTSFGIGIFTDKNNIHRYKIDSEGISHCPKMNGNVVGIYQMKDISLEHIEAFYYQNLIAYSKKGEIDFIEYVQHLVNDYELRTGNPIKGQDINVIDIGDKSKYEKYLETSNIDQRWFNNIEFKEQRVIKSANSEYGKTVIDKEIQFYEFVEDNKLDHLFPKIHIASNHSIEMENLIPEGFETVHQSISKLKVKSNTVYHDYLKYIQHLHLFNAKKVDFNDHIHTEYIQVPIERYNKIEYFIPKNVQTVNDIKIPNFYVMMDKLTKYLFDRTYNWGVIHGDTNSSNTMYNSKTKEIRFIDPRGKFGNSEIYGDTQYDIAKFLYGLTGYDIFNLDKYFKFEVIGDDVELNCCETDKLDFLTTDNHLKILVGLIWLKLPFYIRNNPNKIIASYFTGMYLLEKYLPK